MNIQNWAENLTREVYEIWKSKYPRREGIKLFYSKVIKNPELMIIGYQPGGNHVHFQNEDADRFANGDFKVTLNEFLITNYRMANRMREFFEHRPKLLEKSVICPLIFFRAPNARSWRRWKHRKEVEEFCFSKTSGIINKLKPKHILVLGLGTYAHIKTFLKTANEKNIYLKNKSVGKRKVAIVAMAGNIKIFAMLHPTGSRISNEHRKQLRRHFFEWI
ncbi:MAG: hypothetical protein WD898_04100 [Candidatus Paceibacterota bacterium]